MSVALLADVSRYLPAFCDRRALAWCERAAERVPDDASSHYLECRPGTASRIDFMSSFKHPSVAGDFRSKLEQQGVRSAIWAKNQRLLDEWARQGSALANAPLLWFEYDAPSGLEPGAFDASPSVALEKDYYRRHGASLTGLASGATALADAALELLLPKESAALAMRAVGHCFSVLPKAGSVGYVSVMSARHPVTTKLFVVLPRVDVIGFLARAAWPGDLRAAETLLKQFYSPGVRTAYLDITLTDRVGARLGLATSQFQRGEVAGDGSVGSWLRLPSTLGAEAAELERWPGVHLATIEGVTSWVVRWLDAKAVLDGDHVEYKTYLGFMRHLPTARA